MKQNTGHDPDPVESVYRELPFSLDSRDPVVKHLLEYILSHRGKGLRPMFMALTTDLAGDDRSRIREAAVVIEGIHIASLLHDDVIDGSGLRRGKETLQVLTSNRTAVLLGDFIFVKALSRMSRIGHPDAEESIYQAVGQMVEGEIRESCAAYPGEPEYLEIIRKKTGSLFAAAGELGVILSGGGPEMRGWGRELGEATGITYQIMDDLLDVAGNPAETGKPAYMDLKRGYITLPLIHSLRGRVPGAIPNLPREMKDSPERIAALIRERGGLDYTLAKAHEYRNRAWETAQRFGNPEAGPPMDAFLHSLITRAEQICRI